MDSEVQIKNIEKEREEGEEGEGLCIGETLSMPHGGAKEM